MFEPILTERLRLRPVVAADAGPLAERRSEPTAAALQSWETPFPVAAAEAMIAELLEVADPPVDDWWMLTVERLDDGAVVGDLALRLHWDGRAAEIGYTFAVDSWGLGFATEATGALIDHLWERPELTRIAAQLHPDNHRSARVLEKLGFRYEGRTKLSYWVGDDNTDDLLYGMVREDRAEWLARATGRPADVRRVEVTPHKQDPVLRLETHQSQRRFVAPTVFSLADAQVPEVVDGAAVVPWYRAVEADGELAGFVMLSEITEAHVEPYLWRLLIDRRHQRRGIGDRVIDLVAEQCRAWNASSLLVSYVEDIGGPEPFYRRRRFVPTGEIIDGETEARLMLDEDA
ncbi:MAG: GNAT family N-acetyltransferase [Actinomycetota bacterium]